MTSDSLNVALLKRLIGTSVQGLNDMKSIKLLEMYLDSQSIDKADTQDILQGLRMVQDLWSSSTTHCKGSRFASVLKKYNLDTLSRLDIVKNVFFELTKSITRLQFIIWMQR
ncbi:MAG: hypothetical protein EAX81_05845 [Candidatus Thorarchaeota archaeon]|nr:hypothetical protein [Candidatus Thorarchaeota archaeon]